MGYGLLAAVLFGISTPLSKLLLDEVDPVALAGLLYLGAGIAMGGLAVGRRLVRADEREAGLDRGDALWLVGAIAAGGVLGPILLLLGLQLTHPATASLLLNFEGIATGLLAFAFFREAVSRNTWAAIAAVAAGGAILSVDFAQGFRVSPGALLIVGACVAWGVDNNLTGRISLKDPRRIVLVKGLVAGAFSLILAVALGRPLPTLGRALSALALGAVSYGTSIALFVLSLRQVGAARTGAAFGVAPFVGAALSLAITRQLPAWPFFAALPIMGLSTILLTRERHSHTHRHAAVMHAHAHRHDDGHHEHAHQEAMETAQTHVHGHTHDPVQHSHEHKPDQHHRHRHARKTSAVK